MRTGGAAPATTLARRGGAVERLLVTLLVGVAAAALVWLRLRLIPLPTMPRVAALAAIYAGILVACLLVPSRRRAGRPVLALGVGLVGVAAAAVAAGAPPPQAFVAAAMPLSVLAAFAEEALFRRTLYDALEPYGTLLAIVLSAILFAAIHIPLYGVAAFPVDLGAGLLFGWQRWAAGTWTVPGATHALANVIGSLR